MNTDELEDDDLDIENEVEDWEPEDWDIDDMVASRVNEKLGIELDLDCIENFPSSAMNPIGFSISDARNYLSICKNHTNIGYYHLTEAAVIESGDERIVGKVLAQLTYDIITEFTY